MQYLVQMKIVPQGRPLTNEAGADFVEQVIYPTLEKCEELHKKKRILAGGPMSAVIGLAFIVAADSAQELDELITSLPVWPRMETQVTPLTTFEARIESLRPRLEELRALDGRAS